MRKHTHRFGGQPSNFQVEPTMSDKMVVGNPEKLQDWKCDLEELVLEKKS